MKHTLNISLAFILCSTLCLAQKIIRVPQDYATIQAAINGATNGDTVLVAEGTYSVNLLVSKKIVLGSLYLVDRDTSHITKTILDGGSPGNADSASVIRLLAGTDTNTVITGFTIQNGKGTKCVFSGSLGTFVGLYGGGIVGIAGGATITHNIIKNNQCMSSTVGVGAAGIDLLPSSDQTIKPSPWFIAHNTIENNTSISTAASTAGWAEAGGVDLAGNGKFINNVVKNNSVWGSYYGMGGGMYVYSIAGETDIQISNNLIIANQASTRGGGIFSAMTVGHNLGVTCSNNIIVGNVATRGSAFYINSGDYTLINNTIANNSGWEAISLSAGGGTLTFRLLNNIVWNPGTMVEINSLDYAAAQYNCIRGGYPGAGNFSANPNFIPGDQMCRLSDSSYCIGRGIDSATVGSFRFTAPKSDIMGTLRPSPSGSRPDVGAVEHTSGTARPLPWQPVALQFSMGGISRSCLVEIPRQFALTTNLPVVFSLNGYGGDACFWHNYVQTHLLGDSVGYITVYPEAYNKRWNSGIAANSSWPTPNVDDVAFISAIIDSLIARYSIDTTRVYSCGFSNGGFMSLRLAAQLSNRIAAAASVGGVMTTISAALYSASRPVPVMLVHGTADNTVPFGGGVTNWYSVNQTIDFWKQKNACSLPAETLYVPNRNLTDNSTVEVCTYRSASNSSQVKLYKVVGGAHEWPGAPSYLGAGVINYDIDANREIWEFFRLYTLSNVNAVATAPELVFPVSQSDVPRRTTFLWHSSKYATAYHVQVSLDTEFVAIERDTLVADTALKLSSSLMESKLYYWRVSVILAGREGPFSTMAHFTTGLTDGVEREVSIIPGEFALHQNYPNPFNPATAIEFQIPKQSTVTLKVFDLLGREVVTLVNEVRHAGFYTVRWDASQLSSGVYFYRLRAGGYLETKRMILMK